MVLYFCPFVGYGRGAAAGESTGASQSVQPSLSGAVVVQRKVRCRARGSAGRRQLPLGDGLVQAAVVPIAKT
jgi:hypothetical protein